MEVIIGSARIDENGHIAGGAAGDQKQNSVPDFKGEVSMQPYYTHAKKWLVLRPKNPEHAMKIAAAMITACNNKNIGYDQNGRYGIIKNGTNAKVPTECDCSSLVRRCIIEATWKDPGDFNTSTEVSILLKTGLFEDARDAAIAPLCTGDILVTKTKGHTAVVTAGYPRKSYSYYPGLSSTLSTTSIVEALRAVGEKDTSFEHRKKIAEINDITTYTGTAAQNTYLLNELKLGRLKRG